MLKQEISLCHGNTVSLMTVNSVAEIIGNIYSSKLNIYLNNVLHDLNDYCYTTTKNKVYIHILYI